MDVDTPAEAEPTESAPATAPASDAEGAAEAPKTPKTPARRKSKPRRITMTKTRRSSTARHRADLVRFDADDEPPKVDDVVFAQVKGHPFWPAMVLADSNVPAEMLAQRKHPSEVPVIFFGSFQLYVLALFSISLWFDHE
ncbi:hypothetical protein AMAG_05516 [Allomyces macrogynus ATCC 38327]|uniref:PWWP domain-containing protein n=1 Tax=Allomyces macrogynus (strain ATCC 38327) TaxID=578462 RepID=A0A0L0SCH2_ALLM3|nr:hypothetical protein AMAG_05516 [Allomyces macrogynus ATCC 38327]|eukprot:KNE60085.1 hypothetical protein AMAG_05516 [Allomyces macrogynus ATCC 38327]